MTSVLPFVVVLVVLLALAVFFWIWWVGPQGQVPPHLNEIELRRLEVQDRLRQTNYQILTALGLGVTVLATVIQLTITSRQWSEDYQLRTEQERLGRYADALKALDSEKAPANISGIGSLLNLALQDPVNYHLQVNEVLSTLVRRWATEDHVQRSWECQVDSSNTVPTLKASRGEAPLDVQAAMRVLGDPRFARYRQKFSSGACETGSASRVDLAVLRLDHRYLDELDLSGKDFSCADLTQSHFRRTSFNHAVLRGTDFRGARIADFEIPGFPEDRIVNRLYKSEKEGGPPGWMLYRCWETDFRGADLTHANFEGTAVAGADFSGANLTDANFCRADVSRANFTKAIPNKNGELKTLLADACVGPATDAPLGSPEEFIDTAQPFGLDFKIPRCSREKICP